MITLYRAFLRHTKLVAISTLCCLAGCSSLPTTSGRYRGPWQAIDPYVARTLSMNISKIGPLCVTARMRPAFNKTGEYGEYLVYCAPDGRHWHAFIVFPALNQVLGPEAPYPEIPPPTLVATKGTNQKVGAAVDPK